MDKKDIAKAQNYLLQSSYSVVLSGAAISADTVSYTHLTLPTICSV